MLPSAQTLPLTPSQGSRPPYLLPLVDPVCSTVANVYAYSTACSLHPTQSVLELSENHLTHPEDAKAKL